MFSSPLVTLSTEVRNINGLWPFFRSSVSVTRYAVRPQPQGRLLAHLPDVRPIAWRPGAVSSESANFPFSLSSVLPSGDWKSRFSSSLATVTIFCGFCYCYPAPCPREARVPLFGVCSQDPYLLFLCEIVVSLELCSKCVGSVLHFSFSFDFHFPFPSRMLLVGFQLDARPSRYCKWPHLTRSLMMASGVQFGM